MKNIVKKFVLLTISLVVFSFFVSRQNAFANEIGEESPRISVILPIYNVEKYLDESLRTVENQTYKNLEIICVNDGSPDNCDKILEEHAQKDNRIRIISQENSGTSVARNVGYNAATGDLICYFDPDDFLVPHTLERIVDIFKRYKNIDAVEFGLTRVPFGQEVDLNSYKYDERKIKLLECRKGQNPYEIFKTHGWSVCKYVYKKSFFKDNGLEFKKGLRTNEDVLFSFLAMSCMKKVVRDSNIGYIYRINRPGSTSGSALEVKLNSFIKIVNEIINNRARFKFKGSDEHILNFMLNCVFMRVKYANSRQESASRLYHDIWNNFVKKYNVKLSDRNEKRLKQLKIWASGSEKEKTSGSTKNAIKGKNKKLQHNSAHRSRKIYACG